MRTATTQTLKYFMIMATLGVAAAGAITLFPMWRADPLERSPIGPGHGFAEWQLALLLRDDHQRGGGNFQTQAACERRLNELLQSDPEIARGKCLAPPPNEPGQASCAPLPEACYHQPQAWPHDGSCSEPSGPPGQYCSHLKVPMHGAG